MSDDADKQVSFLPFHAINEFMTNEYRQEVIRKTLFATVDLPEAFNAALERNIKKNVKIAGFRNSAKAPAALKVKPVADAFEKSPAMVAVILAAWAEIHADLRQRIFELLSGRKWELLPLDADRTRLPGFLTVWPAGEIFEALNAAYAEKYPEFPEENNDISLMCVWLSNRLPYEFREITRNLPTTTQAE